MDVPQNIYDTRSDSFPTIHVGQATRTVGDTSNSFLLKMSQPGNSAETRPILVKTPVAKFKQSNKKGGCELSMSVDESEFYDWMERIEAFGVDYLFQNQKKWFQTELTQEDVENLFISPFKIYKSAKTYTMRAYLGSSFQVFQPDRTPVPISDTFITELPVTSTVEIVGIRCTSKSFQLELFVRDLTFVEQPQMQSSLKPVVPLPLTPVLPLPLEELVEVHVDDIDAPLIKVKPSAEVYQDIYERALNKGCMARDLGVLNYLESKNIENTQLLLDIL